MVVLGTSIAFPQAYSSIIEYRDIVYAKWTLVVMFVVLSSDRTD